MNGIILVDKPEGPTSSDCVQKIRHAIANRLKIKPRDVKVGHGGTLDPFATGLSVVLVGQATKLSDIFLQTPKTYSGVIRLGIQTDTADKTGVETATKPIPHLSESEWNAFAQEFLAREYLQTPPMYSAKKIDGVRLHEMARKDETVERLPILKKITEFTLIKKSDGELSFTVECESGTYVRVLAEDLAKKAGTLAHLSELRRTKSGGFEIQQSMGLEDICAQILDPAVDLDHSTIFKDINSVIHKLPSLELSDDEAVTLAQGNVTTIHNCLRKLNHLNEKFIVGKNLDRLVALFEKTENESYRLQRVFHL